SPGCQDARTGDAPVADGIAQKEVRMSGRTEIADGGEPGQERGARRVGAYDLIRGLLRGVRRLPRQVRVRVDEPGQGERVAQRDDLRMWGNLEPLTRSNRRDPSLIDEDELLAAHDPRFHIEETPDLDGNHPT